MLREGPIPRFVHGVYEYLLGAFMVAAPFLFDFGESKAIGTSIGVGVVLLVLAAMSGGRTGLVEQIPTMVHVVIDLILAVFMIVAPFLLTFTGEGGAVALFIIVGVLHLLVLIGTRFRASVSTP